MKASLPFLLAAAAVAAPAFAQSDGACILAGRLTEEGQWAPRFAGVQLLAGNGQAISGSSREALAAVRQVRLAQAALLSQCTGNGPLASGDDEPPGRKTQVPALAAGIADVDGVSFPKLRTGGELVELRVRYPAARVVMLSR